MIALITLVLLALPLTNQSTHDILEGVCDGKHYEELPFLCYKRGTHRQDFQTAQAFCSRGSADGQLMTVGKLRHFNASQYWRGIRSTAYKAKATSECRYDDLFESGIKYRINGQKDSEGIWREQPSNKEIFFGSFPSFDQTSGHRTQTLLWDPNLNQLSVDHMHTNHPVLCESTKSNSKSCLAAR